MKKNTAVSLRKIFLKQEAMRGARDCFSHLGDLHHNWIWLSGAGADQEQVLLFRKRLTLAQPLRTRIHISADHRFDLYVNDEWLARGPERGDPQHWFVHTYELTLPAGKHTVVARCWWLPRMAAVTQMTRGAGFLLRAEGEADALLSTGVCGWEVAVMDAYRFERPYITWGAHGHTFVDGFLLPDDFSGSASLEWQPCKFKTRQEKTDLYNHSNWYLLPSTLPDMMNRPIATGVIRFAEKLRCAKDALLPVASSRHDAHLADGLDQLVKHGKNLVIPPRTCVQWLIDLDDYYCAYPHIKVSGGKGSSVQIYWAESLYHDHPTHNKGNRNEIEGKVIHADGDHFYPDGRKLSFDLLWWRVGRYVQLIVETEEQALELIGLEFFETGYPLEKQGSFSADDPDYAKPLPLVERALRASMHDIYADGPYYEQLQYMGDARLEMLATYMLTRDDRLPRKVLQCFDWSRLPEGFTQSRYPSPVTQVIPTFSLWWVCAVREYYMWRDDSDFVAGRLPGVHAVLDAFERYRDKDNLVRQVPWWNFVDWSGEWQVGLSSVVGDGANAIINLQYIVALESAAELEYGIGSDEMAAIYRGRAEKIRKAVVKKFWNTKRHLFACDEKHRHFSEHAQILAVLAGCCNADRLRRVRTAILGGQPLDRATIYFMHYLFEALPALDAMPHFFERLKTWSDLPAMGFRALPESPDPCRSDCHGWGSHLIYHYHTKLLGIRPASPGFATVHIEPHPCHLKKIAGRLPHPQGIIGMNLDINAGQCEVSLPKGVKGTFVWEGRQKRLQGGMQVIRISPSDKNRKDMK